MEDVGNDEEFRHLNVFRGRHIDGVQLGAAVNKVGDLNSPGYYWPVGKAKSGQTLPTPTLTLS